MRPEICHAWHLYVVQVPEGRAAAFRALRDSGIGVNVHYVPVHLHPFYRRRFGTEPGLCPQAEQAYERLLSLPMYSGMRDADVGAVIAAIRRIA